MMMMGCTHLVQQLEHRALHLAVAGDVAVEAQQRGVRKKNAATLY
jgi:hypothetical protein